MARLICKKKTQVYQELNCDEIKKNPLMCCRRISVHSTHSGICKKKDRPTNLPKLRSVFKRAGG